MKKYIPFIIPLLIISYSYADPYDDTSFPGGYLSLGPGLASTFLKIPLFIHEQNSIAGSANKLLAYIAKETFEGFPESFNKTEDNIHFVGNPVRTEITTFTSTSKVEKVNFKIFC